MKKLWGLLSIAALLCAGCTAQETERDPSVGAGIPDSATGRLAEIKERGYLTVATEPYWVPNEFIDPTLTGDDKYVGSDIELARYIADKMGVELRIVPLEFTAVLASVPEGKYDLAISALAYTPERAEAMEMSQGYYFSTENAGYGILVPEKYVGVIEDAEDLKDCVIITQSGSIQELMVTEQVPAYKEFKRVGSMPDAYLAVQEGKADAAIVARSSAQLYVDNNPGCGLAVLEYRFYLPPEYDGTRIGMKKGETDLRDYINACIDELIASGQYSEWYDYYTEYGRKLGLSD
ncbi:MAG: transporter substrate-binding domain-containing protein [Solobacterium sp.]|nr:transporter substrate-binding domain-containing protein [Solobacterium sp.]